MLKTFLTNCTNCYNLSELLCEIDAHLYYYTNNMHLNICLMTDLPYNKEVIGDLLHYKRIITKKIFNPSYAPEVTTQTIFSRVKILINK